MTVYIWWIGPVDGRMGPFSSHSSRKRLRGIVSFSYSRTFPVSKCTHCCLVAKQRIHEILQVRILEWAVISSFRESSRPRDWIHVSPIGRQILYHWATWEALEACESTEKGSEDPSSAAGLAEGPGLSSVSRGFSFHLLVSFFLQWLEPFLKVLLFK